jgi:hypothetical protein
MLSTRLNRDDKQGFKERKTMEAVQEADFDYSVYRRWDHRSKQWQSDFKIIKRWSKQKSITFSAPCRICV